MDKNLEKPKVSIVIPTYNSSETLAECLKSIHEQYYPFHEVIVVDNFSSDNTIKIATKFGARIMQRKCNPALARNIGVANSTGKYILFLDSDQVLSPSVVEECVRKCESERFGMIRIPEVFIGKNFWNSCSAIWKNCYQKVEQCRTSENVIRGEPRFFVKSQIIRAGMLNVTLLWGENYDLYNKLEKMDIRETSCKSKLCHYEPTSVRKILVKNLRYGKSMPIFVRYTRKQIFKLMFKHSLLTFSEVFKNFKKSPATIWGCSVLLCLKTYSMVFGLLIGLIFPIDER